MANALPYASWNDVELRLAILQVLFAAQKKRPSGGASGLMLMDCLNTELPPTEQALHWLTDSGFIEAGERLFQITNKGVDYLIDQLPPPDPSRVPRRPLPTSGDSSIALPLPQSELSNEA